MEGGKAPELTHQEGGYDAFKTPNDEPAYAVKGPGFVAFGPDQALIAAIARPGEKTLDKALTPTLTQQFLAGDVGVYVNASAAAWPAIPTISTRPARPSWVCSTRPASRPETPEP